MHELPHDPWLLERMCSAPALDEGVYSFESWVTINFRRSSGAYDTIVSQLTLAQAKTLLAALKEVVEQDEKERAALASTSAPVDGST